MLTFTNQPKVHGSTRQVINVDRDGQPFAQLWTWPDTKDEEYPWHAKLTNVDSYAIFWKRSAPLALRIADGEGGLKAAKAWVARRALGLTGR